MSKITILIVNYNTSDFIGASLSALSKLTNNSYKIIICDNGSSWIDKLKLKRITRNHNNVELIWRKQSLPGSMGHGEALNILINKINTKYGVILDADAVFLKKGWDTILINQLDPQTKIIGAPPLENPIKPTDFPSVYTTLFETETFKYLQIDMRPGNRAIGNDTGWEMRKKFLKNGFKSKVLDVKSTRKYKKGPFKDVVCGEYYLNGYDGIFASHFGRGSTLGVAKYNAKLNIPLITRLTKKIRGYIEKNEWLTICKKTIDKESNQILDTQFKNKSSMKN